MNDLKIFDNEELGISTRTILNDDGSISVNAEDTAVGFGWTQIQTKNGKQYTSIRWETLNGYCEEFGFPNKLGKDDYIPESLFYRLGMKASNERADKFQNWLAIEVIPQLRKTGMYSINKKSNIEQGIAVVKFIADDLKVSESSRLFMYENYCKDVGIPTGFLPKYTDNGNREQCSATILLERNGCNIKAAKFNQLLIAAGYMEVRERPSSKGGTKDYKALTEKGLEYGINLISNKNQKEVQPYYFADTFMDLYNKVIT